MAIFSGDIFAENYTVSSSVTNVQISSVSGSTTSGDSTDDIHQFTGSIRLGGNSTGLRVDDGHVRAGRDIMLGSIDESYTNRNTNLQLYYGSGGQAGFIYFQKNGTGTQYELAANETVFNIKSHRDNQGIGFYTSISGNSPVERLRITGNKISGSATSTGSFGAIFNPGIHSNPTKLTFAGTDAQFESGYNSSKVTTNGNQMTFYNTSANSVGYIYAATSLLQIGAYYGNRGTIQFTADNGSTLFAEMTGSYTISGSATGTGSFGNMVVRSGHIKYGTTTTDGLHNIIFGSDTNLDAVTNGGYNVAIGNNVFSAVTDKAYNIGIGRNAGATLNNNYNIAIGYGAGGSSTAGSSLIFMGLGAGENTTSASGMIALGQYALRNNSAAGVIAIGSSALQKATSPGGAVAVGYNAGAINVTGTDGTYIGYQAGQNADGNSNTFVGKDSGLGVSGSSSGTSNTALGYQTLTAFTTGYGNVAVGTNSLDAVTEGFYNIGIGPAAGGSITTGDHNIAMGFATFDAATTTGYTIAMGYMALSAYTHAESSYNVAIGGHQVAYLKTSGRFNTYIGGYKNAAADLTGEKNVWIGSYANQYGTDTDSTTLVGYEAGRYATGSYNTFIGTEAGKGGTTSAPYSSGTHNTALGRQALGGFTTGGSNTAIGSQAGNSIKTGTENAFLGYNAGYNATGSMSYGVAIGSHAGYQNNNGSVVYIGRYAGYAGSGAIGGGNIGIGYQALFTNSSTDVEGMKWNIAIGRSAMGAAGSSHGAAHSNVAIGYTALKNIESGSRNIAIGGQQGGGDGGTGEFLKNGDDNTFVGAKAGQGIDSGNINSSDNVFIGSLAGNNQNGVDGNVGVGYKALVFARGNYSVAVDMKLVTMQLVLIILL